MSALKLFTVAFKQFSGMNEVVENVSADYFKASVFTEADREHITKLELKPEPHTHSYTRGAGVTEAPQMTQPNNSFKVVRTQ